MTVDKFRDVVEQFMIPGNAVDVGLHDAQIRHRRREVRVHHRAQMAIEVVRGDVDLMRVGGCGDFHRLPDAVPWRIDDGHVHRLLAEIGHELAQAEQRLAGADRVRALSADGA